MDLHSPVPSYGSFVPSVVDSVHAERRPGTSVISHSTKDLKSLESSVPPGGVSKTKSFRTHPGFLDVPCSRLHYDNDDLTCTTLKSNSGPPPSLFPSFKVCLHVVPGSGTPVPVGQFLVFTGWSDPILLTPPSSISRCQP